MILNDNSTQQINTLVIQLQNRITNLTNESRKLNKEISDLDSEISDLERKVSSNENDASDMNTEISDLERRISSLANDTAAMNTEISANTEAISGKADKNHTHTKSEITDFPTSLKNPNALTVNGKIYDGSTAVDAGVQTVANGGTGVTTQSDINKAFIGNLEAGESDVTDGTEFVSSYASDNGFAETAEGALNKPYKRKFSAVWNYIKDKISSVLGLTASSYSNVQIGGAGVTGSKLTIQGNALGSNSYTDTNPKLEFKNDDGGQNISLTFTDADAVQAPASLTLNGNQGNEYFIAPNIKITKNLTLPADTIANLDTYGKDPLSIGFPSGTGDGQSLGFDRNSIQVRKNGATTAMYLNYYGGIVVVNELGRSDGGLKVKQKMVIPIGAPSSLEDGCIWIER